MYVLRTEHDTSGKYASVDIFLLSRLSEMFTAPCVDVNSNPEEPLQR